jgi:uncharacterized protein
MTSRIAGCRWALLACAACQTASADTPPPIPVAPSAAIVAPAAASIAPAAASAVVPSRQATIVARAREEVARRVVYDSSYARLTYPGGDLDPSRGVCTDVVVRSLRTVGVDLQQRVHADILARPSAYPWISAPDANIDHRRVRPLLTYLKAHATVPGDADWEPGDIVVWAFEACPKCTPDHVGVISDKRATSGRPLVIHNVGPRPTEDDVLEAWTVLGHFRL